MSFSPPDSSPRVGPPVLRRTLVGLLLAALGILCLWVIRPFLSPILWAAIFAYVTWPVYSRLRVRFHRFRNATASMMTLAVASLAVIPLVWLLVLVQHELVDTYRDFTVYLSHGPHTLPAAIRDLPVAGTWLQESLDRYGNDPGALGREFTAGLRHWSGQITALAGNAGRNLGKLLVALVTLFFFYRDGDVLLDQFRRITDRFLGDRLDRPLRAAGLMTRAVVYGLLITAFAQGIVAGIGYAIFGLDAPVLLGALTGLLSTAPLLGTAFVWVPVGVGLLIAGHTWKAIGLLAWGALLVNPTDNILRPLLISNVTHVPFLLVMFGALGGLVAFGLIGVFVGPVLLGVASAIWHDWASAAGAAKGA
ncbi:MAG: AI-2E family transporter [Proteobacteria bacterium]|nr:AI-2E family transporter [Pseudomonadota bacterium]